MTDHVSKEKRSNIMKKVRGKNTSPELLVRKIIYSLGYRYRLHGKDLPGKPDIVFRWRKKVIFIHGCFWHAHGCKKGQPPKSNLPYWIPKLQENKIRDQDNIKSISAMGWSALIIWQCEIKSKDELIDKINSFLKG